jgi:hypothetical protein
VKLLQDYDNVLSDGHGEALIALVGLMTKMAQGELQGRWAFGLPTGMGKSLSIVSWVATLAVADAAHISVAVSCSKVEALCQMKRHMMEQGVSEDQIGLIHSHGQQASMPSTGDADRQIMLVTHSRVRDGSKLGQFSHHKGKPRDLLIYDESLITTDSVGLAVRDLKGCIGFLAGKYEDSEKHQPLVTYLRSCLDMIQSKLRELAVEADSSKATEALVSLPPLECHLRDSFRITLGKSMVNYCAVQLLDIGQAPIRVIYTGQGGAVSYTVAVPKELENIIILDASHPVRRLIHLDSTIKDAEKELPVVRRIAPLAALKRFDNVTIYQMFSGGGRSTMAADFGKPEKERKVTREIVEVIKKIPLDEAVLVFTHIPKDKLVYERMLLDDLSKAGIDTKATVTFRGEHKPRICVLRWGSETSLNSHSYCQHVILAGIVQRSQVDLAAAYLGQTGDLTGSVSYEKVKELINSECTHVAYQAGSRGSCRDIVNGFARRMSLYLIHRDASIRTELQKVMPGATWKVWEKQYGDPGEGVVATTASRIAGYLETLPKEIDKVSTKAIKKEVPELAKVAKRTFSHAVQVVEELAPWRTEGLSLVRMF